MNAELQILLSCIDDYAECRDRIGCTPDSDEMAMRLALDAKRDAWRRLVEARQWFSEDSGNV